MKNSMSVTDHRHGEHSDIMSDKFNVTNFMQLRPSSEVNSSRHIHANAPI